MTQPKKPMTQKQTDKQPKPGDRAEDREGTGLGDQDGGMEDPRDRTSQGNDPNRQRPGKDADLPDTEGVDVDDDNRVTQRQNQRPPADQGPAKKRPEQEGERRPEIDPTRERH